MPHDVLKSFDALKALKNLIKHYNQISSQGYKTLYDGNFIFGTHNIVRIRVRFKVIYDWHSIEVFSPVRFKTDLQKLPVFFDSRKIPWPWGLDHTLQVKQINFQGPSIFWSLSITSVHRRKSFLFVFSTLVMCTCVQ